MSAFEYFDMLDAILAVIVLLVARSEPITYALILSKVKSVTSKVKGLIRK
jgi:hypothetical protein